MGIPHSVGRHDESVVAVWDDAPRVRIGRSDDTMDGGDNEQAQTSGLVFAPPLVGTPCPWRGSCWAYYGVV